MPDRGDGLPIYPLTQSDKLGKPPAGVSLPITTGQDACYHYELDPELA